MRRTEHTIAEIASDPRRTRPWATALLAFASVVRTLAGAKVGLRLLYPPRPPDQQVVPEPSRDLPTLKELYELAAPNARGTYKGLHAHGIVGKIIGSASELS